MTVGDKVIITSKTYFKYDTFSRGKTSKTVGDINIKPIECIVLGYTHIYEGVVVWEDSPEYYYNEAYMTKRKSVKVWVVQPVSRANRYLKHFYTRQGLWS